MKLLGPTPDVKVKPTPYSAAPTDTSPFDSVPGHGFDTNASAAAIVPPAGKLTGSGAVLSLDPAQNNTYRALNRAWKSGATVQFASGRYLVSGLGDTAQADLVKSLALVAERVGRVRRGGEEAAHRPLPSVERQHGRRLDALGPRAIRIRVRDAASRGLQDAAHGQS